MTQFRTPHPVMAALAAGIPLTLLADLADERGPDSRHIHRREQADLSWLQGISDQSTSAASAQQRTCRSTG
jgi:hypothetical protein